MTNAPATATSSPPARTPEMTRAEAIAAAEELPLRTDRVTVLVIGGSTYRAEIIDRNANRTYKLDVLKPAGLYEDPLHAVAGTALAAGHRTKQGVAVLAGPVPALGPLKLTNLNWPEFDRTLLEEQLGMSVQWYNDGAIGYEGLKLLRDPGDFTLLYPAEKPGRNYGRFMYGIVGTGLNTGLPGHGREDGQGPFAALTDEEREYFDFLVGKFGHWPSWERAFSGGEGFAHAAEFYLTRQGLGDERFARALQQVPFEDRGPVVTQWALDSSKTTREKSAAMAAVELVGAGLGNWLGSMAVANQVACIDLCPGVFASPGLWAFLRDETNFMDSFFDRGRPEFIADAQNCTLRVCRTNPEVVGARRKAAELLYHN